MSAFHDTCTDVWLIQGGLAQATAISDFTFAELSLTFIGTKEQNNTGTDLKGYTWHGTLIGETFVEALGLTGNVFTEFGSEVSINILPYCVAY